MHTLPAYLTITSIFLPQKLRYVLVISPMH